MTGAALAGLALIFAAGCAPLHAQSPLSDLEAPEPLAEPLTTWLDLGQQYLQAGRPSQAQRAFVRSMRVEGMTAAAMTGAGLAAEQQGLLTEARRFFERARDLAPSSVIAHNNLGAVLYALKEYHPAKKAFLAAFALSSGKNRVATHNLSLVELALERELAENPQLVANPRPLQREGSGEYRLLATIPEEQDG
ncbi:MAG: tetratricopeptide repeat protein [Pseudomonadota bacterium]